ncbi:MAG TPA: 4Fe-4S dicluster domain-containing protein, partial [Desulfohalobiaceae bacterium]|nr:4Fe-4S dicluster domain-containing protein [Desulfohalobiaceae bacterium]
MSGIMQIHHKFNVKWGMVIDIDKCTGCGACMVACQAENNIPPSTKSFDRLRTVHWLIVYKLSNGKNFPNHDIAYLPRPCMQCGNPSCVSVCPVVATTKDEEGGIVSQIYPRCIG